MDLNELTLITLTRAHETACRAFMQDFIDAGEGGYGWLEEYREHQSFQEYLDFLEISSRGEYKPEIYVPQTAYWLSSPQGEILAVSRLRHYLNPPLEIEGGHIGYAVRPSARRQGCATRLLALMLDKARAIGLTRVLITCDSTNTGSARTIEKNGGVLEDQRLSPDREKWIKRYWITLV
jgi:predicted acetyltransferase